MSNKFTNITALENLLQYTTNRTFIICPDNDVVGIRGLDSIIFHLWKKHDVYISEIPKQYEGHKMKDINDLICGTEKPFHELIQLISLNDWYINKVINNDTVKDLNNISDIDKDKVLIKLYQQYKNILNSRQEEFIIFISNILKLNNKIIETKFKQFRNNEKEQENNKKIQELAQKLKDNSNNKKKSKDIVEQIHDIMIKQDFNDEKLLKLYTLDNLNKDLRTLSEGFKTGFSEVDNICSILPNAMNIIVGRTGKGKTIFLMNLLLNMQEQYKKHSFIFLSYEEKK